ncbi:MAG: hypothetical protein ACRDPY_38865 [Streptosporangiaceae bacterium]
MTDEDFMLGVAAIITLSTPLVLGWLRCYAVGRRITRKSCAPFFGARRRSVESANRRQ